jgi:putative ATPase
MLAPKRAGGYAQGMPDLWTDQRTKRLDAALPLAARMRPTTFDDVLGQEAVNVLRRMASRPRLGSVLVWGPPGTGKTTLARVLAMETGRDLAEENAATVGVARIREILAASKTRIESGQPPLLLFLDEIHRFSRSQQDVLLRDVEAGVVDLIGATTENPWASCTKALISRATVLGLEQLPDDAVETVLRRACDEDNMLRGFSVDDDALVLLAQQSAGDARRALNALELAASTAVDGCVTASVASNALGRRGVSWDRDGAAHYDHASALIKSIRSSHVDASLHWLAVMLEGGEDPMFIARRLAISASEDIGLASPQALQLAGAMLQVVERVGLPEAEYALAQCTIYLASAPKSDSTTRAIHAAREDVRANGPAAVPLALRPSRAPGGGDLGHGVGYVHGHGDPNGAWAMCDLGPNRRYFTPGDAGFEASIAARLKTPEAP